MGPLGFGERLLWIGFIGPDRRMHKALSQMPVELAPNRDAVDTLLAALTTAVAESAPGSTLAALLTRPGSDGVSADDRRWSEVLTESARTVGAPLEPVFRANDRDLVPI